MCGIVGVVTHNARFSIKDHLGQLHQMPQALIHRGPEHVGYWYDQNVFLSQTRLKIIDLSEKANPPLFNEDRSIALIFNGEIYNFKDLKNELIEKGHTFYSHGDGEVIVHLYEEEGEESVQRLDGMFALALWDIKNRRLLLARDRTGKKPLFYYDAPSLFAFGSEIKSFFPLKAIPISIQETLLPHYFISGYIPTPFTYYKSIFALEPGHLLCYESSGKKNIKQFWNIESKYCEKNNTISEPEAIEKVRYYVKSAVSKRLISDVKLGAFLSGGIDSSIITGIVTQELKRPLKTFSIGFGNHPDRDETSFARIAAKHYGTEHTEYHVTPKDFPELVDDLLWHYDGPFGDTSCVPTAMVSKLAKEMVTVVLTGDGGDEAFAGYNRFLSTLWIDRCSPLLPQKFLKSVLQLFPHPTLQRLSQTLARSPEESITILTSFFYDDLAQLLNPSFFKRDIQANFYAGSYHKNISMMDTLSKMLYLNLKTYLLDDLNVKMDRASMAYALETRSPFLDHHLLEFTASLPSHFLIKGTQKKYILKKAYQYLLPSSIYHRKKLGFDAPLDDWFRGPLKPYIMESLMPLSSVQDYLNTAYVNKIIEQHMKGKNYSLKIWNILMFKKWITSYKFRDAYA